MSQQNFPGISETRTRKQNKVVLFPTWGVFRCEPWQNAKLRYDITWDTWILSYTILSLQTCSRISKRVNTGVKVCLVYVLFLVSSTVKGSGLFVWSWTARSKAVTDLRIKSYLPYFLLELERSPRILTLNASVCLTTAYFYLLLLTGKKNKNEKVN